MKLKEFFAPYKYFDVACSSDNKDILDLFRQIDMDAGGIALRYERGNDFFAFMREQAEHFVVLIMRNEDGSIKGLGSIVFIPHFHQGKKVLCAYLGDLRISPQLAARVRLRWKQCYTKLINHFSEIEEFKGVRLLYSAILDENLQAMKSLVKNNSDLVYRTLTSYQTFNIYAKRPLGPPINLAQFSVGWEKIQSVRPLLGQAQHLPGLQYYFKEEGQDELQRRLGAWENFDPNRFLAVKNQKGEIVATAAPWICRTKKLVVTRIGPFYRLLGKYIFPLLGIPQLTLGAEMKVMILSHLFFDPRLSGEQRSAALTLMAQKLLKEERKHFHLISFFVFPDWEVENLPFLLQKTKATLFQVMSREQFLQEEFIELAGLAPAFGLEVA